MNVTDSQTNQPQAATDPFAWLTARRFGFCLALTLFLVYPAIWLGVGTFAARDYGVFTAPMAFYHRESFWLGEMPLWNPYSNCGIPHLAQWNTATLYPPSLIYLLLPFPWSLGVMMLSHLWLAGMGMYFLTHRLAGHRFAAAVAGTVFAWSGLTVNCLYWVSNLGALAWMPWVIWLVEMGWRQGGRWLVAGVAVGTVQMLSGAPEIIVMTWLVLAGLWAGSLMRERAVARAYTRRLILQMVLVGGLAAAQILPFLQLLLESSRAVGGAENMWPMPALGWANFLVPLFRVFSAQSDTSYQLDQYWTYSYYIGTGVWVFAVLGVTLVAGHRRWWWLACALTGAVLALGDNGHVLSWLQAHVPGFTFFRYPIKLVALPVFAVPVLGALGIAAWLHNPESRRVGRMAGAATLVVAVLIAAILWFGTRYSMSYETPGALLRSALQSVAFLLVEAALAWQLVRRQKVSAGRYLAIALLGVIWGDLLLHKPSPHAVLPNAVLRPDLLVQGLEWTPRPVLGEARAMVHPNVERRLDRAWLNEPEDNYLLARGALLPNVNLLEHTPSVHGFYSLFPKYSVALLNGIYGLTNTPPAGVRALLGVQFLQEPDPPYHFIHQTNATPWITAGQAVSYLDGFDAWKIILSTNYAPHEVIYLTAEARAAVGERGRTAAKVTHWQFDRQRITAEVESEQPTVLSVAQNWYPAWHATVNGSDSPVWRANLTFQCVAIPAGHSTVVLDYRDRWFEMGVGISLLSALILAGYAWRNWRMVT